MIFGIFKKKKKKRPEPVKPDPPGWDVPLDQTTGLWRVERDKPLG
ncbi:MAG TPA: hypothetical protein VJ204_15170 [Solirubrobacterales bacterium]|nr:hypothetical protein [Solirubrobacterales bacterium]